MLRRILPILALGAALAACREDPATGPSPQPVPPPPPPPPVLQTGTFDLTMAEGQALPAYIAHRLMDGRLEQVWVDSARLVVTTTGDYEQRIWTRTLRDGVLHVRDTWVDGGSVRLVGQTYIFTSRGGGRQLTVRTALAPVLNVTETMVGWPQAGVVVGVYARRTAPPAEQPPPTGTTRYRATDVAGQTLSAIVVRERDVPRRGAETFVQLDSAWVDLRTDGSYERRAYYSVWETPNYELSLGYQRVARVNDYDRGRWTRAADGVLSLASDYFQGRSATGVHLGDRLRLTQDLMAGDPTRPNVGYVVQGGR